jgi:hypothetical protein
MRAGFILINKTSIKDISEIKIPYVDINAISYFICKDRSKEPS